MEVIVPATHHQNLAKRDSRFTLKKGANTCTFMYRCKHSSIHFWDLFYFYGRFFWTLNSHLQTNFSSDMPISISSLISGLKALALLHYTMMESTTPGIKTIIIIIIMKWRPVETGKKPQAQSCPHWTIFCMLALLEKGQASDFRAIAGRRRFNSSELRPEAERTHTSTHQRSPAAWAMA